MTHQEPTGFIALTSAVIISAVLLIVAATGSLSGFFARGDILDGEYKERSIALADACVDEALVKVSADPSYVGGDTIAVDGTGDTCQILGGAIGTPRIFKIEAVYQHAVTDYLAGINATTLDIASVSEVSHF